MARATWQEQRTIAKLACFVIQKHRARNLHYDFRLEKDGALKSWAVPKGIPEKIGEKHLAIQVEDHALEYANFEGTIPKGEYGAGTVEIWDRGTYDIHEWTDKVIVVTLHGERVQGTYNLVRFPRSGVNAWLLFKRCQVHLPEAR
jgi:bifunctional non-homologous end joining protein LigD